MVSFQGVQEQSQQRRVVVVCWRPFCLNNEELSGSSEFRSKPDGHGIRSRDRMFLALFVFRSSTSTVVVFNYHLWIRHISVAR